jgi:hypothetical protein
MLNFKIFPYQSVAIPDSSFPRGLAQKHPMNTFAQPAGALPFPI